MARYAAPAIPDVIERLEALYGRPRLIERFDPMEELVSCILSQHTSDRTSFPAFTRLRERYPDWEALEVAPTEEVADVIRKAGLANQKARSIQRCLKAIRERFGKLTLDPLRSWPTQQAREWLESLPGVGPKTAAIVLCFSLGRHAIPVDTHVYRVAMRLGWLRPEDKEAEAHDILLSKVPEDWAYRFHVALIQHGRIVCRAPRPRCEACPLTDRCRAYRQERRASARTKARKPPNATSEA